MKRQLDHNEAKGQKMIKALAHDHEKQVKAMHDRTPYSTLPNALTPEQIGQWNKYYKDYSNFAGICLKEPENLAETKTKDKKSK